jgi:hypothetical protein
MGGSPGAAPLLYVGGDAITNGAPDESAGTALTVISPSSPPFFTSSVLVILSVRDEATDVVLVYQQDKR